MSGLYAVRVAARLRREFEQEVTMTRGRYGDFAVLVDDQVVVDGGALAALGVLPKMRTIIADVRQALTR